MVRTEKPAAEENIFCGESRRTVWPSWRGPYERDQKTGKSSIISCTSLLYFTFFYSQFSYRENSLKGV
jgi:hypothetical protein